MPKVTPEDLVNMVIAADDLRRKSRGLSSTKAAQILGQAKASSQRTFIEPFFNALGLLWGQSMRMTPSRFRRPLVQWLNCKMGAYVPKANPDLPARLDQTVRMVVDIKRRTGQWPALLILTSHPNTEGPHQWLRFELLRQGLLIADAVVEKQFPNAWYPPHPRCFVAIDPFALDTVSVPIGGFYAGWMNRTYIAWDRQPSTQSWMQRHLFLRGSHYSRIGWKLLKTLKASEPVLMVLSGGLPYNARLLYASREFVHDLSIPSWAISKRQAQKELMEILMTPEGNLWPADEGEIPMGKQKAIAAAMGRWGVPQEKIASALREFSAEFKLPVPYRARLFHVLLARLVNKGKPVLLLGISHSETAPHVRITDPYEITRAADPQTLARTFGRALLSSKPSGKAS